MVVAQGDYTLVDVGKLRGHTIYLLHLSNIEEAFYAIKIEGKLHFLFERKGDLIDDLQQLIEKEKLYEKAD